MSSHENMSAAGSSVNFNEIAHKMARSAEDRTEGTFSGDLQRLTSGGRSLKDSLAFNFAEDEQEDEEAEEAAAAGTPQKTPDAPAKPPSSHAWFDKDKKIADTLRSTVSKLDVIETSLNQQFDELTEELAAVERLGVQSVSLEHEKLIAKKCRTALEKVLSREPSATHDLKTYIRSFDVEMGTEASFGKAPPCRLYATLATCASLRLDCKKIEAADSKDTLEAIRKDITEKTKPISNLLGAAKSACNDLAKVRSKRQEEIKKQKSGGGGGGELVPDGASKKRRLEGLWNLFEFGPALAQQVQVVATPELFAAAPSGQTWTLPMLITSVALKDSSKHAAMRANADVKAALQTNHTKFLEEERRLKTSIRGSVDFKEPAVASIALEGMLEAFPWKTL